MENPWSDSIVKLGGLSSLYPYIDAEDSEYEVNFLLFLFCIPISIFKKKKKNIFPMVAKTMKLLFVYFIFNF